MATVVVCLPCRAVEDGRLRGGGVGVGGLVQRAVLVELWRKIVHAALGFPAFALARPPLPSLSSLPALLLTPFGRMESAPVAFGLGTGEAANLIR